MKTTNSLRNRSGFTLVEIMTVVFIIGILLAITLPAFTRSRDTSGARSCVSNLRQLDWAKERYALDNNLVNGDTVSMEDLTVSSGYFKSTPSCPRGGEITLNPVGVAPTCSIAQTVTPAHQLP